MNTYPSDNSELSPAGFCSFACSSACSSLARFSQSSSCPSIRAWPCLRSDESYITPAVMSSDHSDGELEELEEELV